MWSLFHLRGLTLCSLIHVAPVEVTVSLVVACLARLDVSGLLQFVESFSLRLRCRKTLSFCPKPTVALPPQQLTHVRLHRDQCWTSFRWTSKMRASFQNIPRIGLIVKDPVQAVGLFLFWQHLEMHRILTYTGFGKSSVAAVVRLQRLRCIRFPVMKSWHVWRRWWVPWPVFKYGYHT